MISPLAVLNEVPFDRQFLKEGGNYVNADVDPSAYIGPFVVVCQGLEQATYVGARTIIEAQTVVGHDAQIGDDVEIASGASIGGYAIIRSKVKIGMKASVLPYVCIGEGAVVGSGAVVTKHVAAGKVVAGVPAKPILTRASGSLRCGCTEREAWDGCPHHGSSPIC